ncbi:hypothetical protein ILUMI_25955 [Ignelater luminosus]|uniref:Hyaluronan-mediated motility receptor C-terminal domain-containing protein n=1 Tax=Ignelater luminosus TaxID=2038154 RepID=A0A8K0C6J0_IGNLU|nr:hypothetical protein ILUMI_25955 [Ignelater luminosus]
MSFSRAKLQRFNEAQHCTPSPADYNINSKQHVSGAVISKGERFSELRSPSQSDNSSFISNSSIPTFKTPNVPRKLKQQASSVDRKNKAVELFKKSDDLEALKEKIVECNNKDLFIQDLTEQVEELKLQLSKLQSQINLLSTDKTNLEGDIEKLNGEHEISIKNLQTKYQQSLESLSGKIVVITDIMEQIKNEHMKLKQENRKDLTELLKSINMLEQFYDMLSETYKVLIDKKTEEIAIKEKQTEELQEQINELCKNHLQLIDSLKQTHQTEVDSIKTETEKTIADMKQQLEQEQQNHIKQLKELRELKDIDIRTLKSQFAEDKRRIESDVEAKIKQLTENYEEAKVLAEMQMKEKCNDIEMNWKLKLDEAKLESDAILKECQAIAEYSIIQTEVEKNKVIHELNEQKQEVDALKAQNMDLKSNYYNVNEKYKQIQVELSNVIVELNEVREDYAREKEDYKSTIEKLTKDKHTYEVTISKTHKTIETLKKRLMRSDKDVEQLKAELEATEESKLEIEGKCNLLMDELQIVCGLCDDMEEQNQIALKITEEKVLQVEQELLNKLETFKQQAIEQVNTATEQLNKTKKDLTDTLEHLHNQQKLNDEAQIVIAMSRKEIVRLEQASDEQVHKNRELQAAFENIQAELKTYKSNELALSKINESLNDENKHLQTTVQGIQKTNGDLLTQLNEFKEKHYKESNIENSVNLQENYQELTEKFNFIMKKLEETEDHNKKLQRKIDEQESLIGPFREHLEAYEMEFRALFSQKEDAEKEAKEMGMKYAQILGHQNQKQKIKHLMDLKKKNYELIENKKDLENKLRAQDRTIEKLKKELLNISVKLPKTIRQQKEDKENFGSPNRTLNTSRHDSPGGPLKERN